MAIPALTSGINGINQGFANLRRDAQAVAQASNPNNEAPVDIARSLVNLKLDSLQVQTSAKVVKSVDDALSHLLDVTA